ncbi:MAG: DUF86 domain-containing protein [Anaerolineae bacterium]|jgi:uncharacterized protein with HEPN domain|nr:DUF86 domain-containing protein [Anaerolineae bacterium]
MKDKNKLLQDMLEAISSIEAYSVPTYEIFMSDDKTQDAIMFNLIVLGEAANNVSIEFQAEHPEIPWSSIIGTRNVIAHGYDQIKTRIVWDIIKNNLSSLRKDLLNLL